jgi:hypothetical protein
LLIEDLDIIIDNIQTGGMGLSDAEIRERGAYRHTQRESIELERESRLKQQLNDAADDAY